MLDVVAESGIDVALGLVLVVLVSGSGTDVVVLEVVLVDVVEVVVLEVVVLEVVVDEVEVEVDVLVDVVDGTDVVVLVVVVVTRAGGSRQGDVEIIGR